MVASHREEDSKKSLHTVVSALLSERKDITREDIQEKIEQFRASIPAVTDQEAEEVAKEIEAQRGIHMGLGSILVNQEFEPWLEDAKSRNEIEFDYWKRYRKLLQKKGIPDQIIFSMDTVTDKTLAQLGNPKDPRKWSRKGMVVGNVQSGKTSNYIGLICKAADAGYRFIIVIAGIHNNLRRQTQARVDEGFIGWDTTKGEGPGRIQDHHFGVGLIDRSLRRPTSLTSTSRDFDKKIADALNIDIDSCSEPVVLVIKKNSSTLKNLIEWLKTQGSRGSQKRLETSMFLIDDEADNASINVKYTTGDISRINGQIREILDLFWRSCYVGYTATPFANIFIDPDTESEMIAEDLFPRHFIIGLDAPSNYFGFEKVFLDKDQEDEEPVFLRYIHDNKEILPLKHANFYSVPALPESLIRALISFILSRIIRNNRGHEREHCTMLVNVSRFKSVQENIAQLLYGIRHDMEESLKGQPSDGKDARDKRNSTIDQFRQVWSDEYMHISDAGIDWKHIDKELQNVLASIRIVQVNSDGSDLSYHSSGELGLTVVAVGGYSLSRGLTLEGLTISYLLRNSKMYDTLMQMGRWFGYRPGYEDLCRIYMSREMAGWYSHISESIDELFVDLKNMEAAKASPENFGLMVRSHPDSLIVTAKNKRGSSEEVEVQVKLSNRYIETARISSSPKILSSNRKAAKELIHSISNFENIEKENSGFLARDVPVEVIADFLIDFVNDKSNPLTDPFVLGRYISNREDQELEKWDVFVSSTKLRQRQEVEFAGLTVRPIVRTVEIEPEKRNADGYFAISGDRARVASRGVEKIGVSEEKVLEAEAEYRESPKFKKIPEGRKPNYPDWIYRKYREKPLFALYLVEPWNGQDGEKSKKLDIPGTEEPVVAWGISFGGTQLQDNSVRYVLNSTMAQTMLGSDDSEEDNEENGDG